MENKMIKIQALIIGGGPAGLATSACLNRLNIPNIVVEREECSASLWKRRSYDRLKLHLAKQYCQLPHMPFPPNAPTFVSKAGFISYLDEYATRFNVNPRYNRNVRSAYFEDGRWIAEVDNNAAAAEREVYSAEYLVVATGENSEALIPEIPGFSESFEGEYLHSSEYKNGEKFAGKHVLVVGSGNSGMEIAYDVSKWDAEVSLVVHSPVHVLTREIVRIGMWLLRFFPVKLVDRWCLFLAKLRFGNTSRYGLIRPDKGPFMNKLVTGRSPTIDVGCVDEIKAGKITVVPSITRVEGKRVVFVDGNSKTVDSIVFATGYKSSVSKWLQVDDGDLFNENGMPKRELKDHWKGKNGLYSVGFGRQGLAGITRDAQNVARDIASLI
ncbi:putative indole-3-pyruvate monooxygenase YUCCA11 [Raphanus sativus]|uniref:Flavin-containing monooxygenase n=1 Tax=Raphanus sativus TaxID=3726 RepID=A0A6J0MAB2_RAPSA|nr:probable indole-3-pyruvate monooxygenase YUCCA11 [Raphanus sativus]KAJ4916323.1 putative indole-3-pyruvate monooxygenase YUCCA11 [Raphanus sativus]